MDIINNHSNRYQSSTNPRQNHEIGMWCAITAIFAYRPFIQNNMSVIFFSIFIEGALWKEKGHMVMLCKMVLQHTLLLILSIFKWSIWTQNEELQTVACKTSKLKFLTYICGETYNKIMCIQPIPIQGMNFCKTFLKQFSLVASEICLRTEQRYFEHLLWWWLLRNHICQVSIICNISAVTLQTPFSRHMMVMILINTPIVGVFAI
jgi:hypothetical protein